MLYVLNTLITPIDFQKDTTAMVVFRKVSLQEAKSILASCGDYISAVGHTATAEILSQILGVPITMQRISVFFGIGDEGLHFVLRDRIPEGKVLTSEELSKLDYDLVYSLRVE